MQRSSIFSPLFTVDSTGFPRGKPGQKAFGLGFERRILSKSLVFINGAPLGSSPKPRDNWAPIIGTIVFSRFGAHKKAPKQKKRSLVDP